MGIHAIQHHFRFILGSEVGPLVLKNIYNSFASWQDLL